MGTTFRGSMVALVTPFHADGMIDWDALDRLIQRQIEGGTQAIISCGTTGEAATMTTEEQRQVIAFTVQQCKGNIPVVAGAGATGTRAAVQLSLQAKEVGVDGLLVVTPPYNKPTQDGLVDYYTTIAKEVKLPIIMYNVPSRTCCHLAPETMQRLAQDPYIVAVKEATADMNVGSEIVERCGDNLTLLSGDDFTAFPLLSLGAQGWISVTANIVPQDLRALWNAWEQGNLIQARALHYQMLPMHRILFRQSNPIPCKKALALLGLCAPHTRSPLLDMTGSLVDELRTVLRSYGLPLA